MYYSRTFFQFIKQLQKLVIEDINKLGASDSLEKEKLDVEQDLFKLLCYKAEAVRNFSKFHVAFHERQQNHQKYFHDNEI